MRRSYTPLEVSGLCRRAGVADASVVHHWPYFRFCAVRTKTSLGALPRQALS